MKNMMVWAIWAWFIFAVFFVVVIPTLMLAVAILPRHLAYAYARASIRLLLAGAGIRVRVRGLENWDVHQPYVLMGNHVTSLDGFFLVAAFPRSICAIEKRENFRIPLYGRLMRRWGNIPIDRRGGVKAIKDLENAIRHFGRDAWIVVMPEGTRTRSGHLGPFKKGGFHMALSAGVPIAAYSLVGAREILCTGSWRVKPGTVEIVCHRPIDAAGYGVRRMDELIAEVRDTIAGPLDEVETAAPVAAGHSMSSGNQPAQPFRAPRSPAEPFHTATLI